MNFRFQHLQIFLCALLLFSCGCGASGDIGKVEGIVTLDGKPLDQASIAFYPTEGRASMGMTDADGRYELTYSRNAGGAEIGEHRVTISTKIDEEVDYGDSDYENDEEADIDETQVTKARKETMPKKYRDPKATELTATVKSGSNNIDFELTSD